MPLTLLHTADIHSRLFPYDLLITQVDANLGLGPANEMRNVGGVGRMAHILNRERARSSRVLHLSGGDCFQGAPIFNFFQGEPEMRAQSYLSVDAMAIANHEFDLGPLNVARQIQKWADFSVLAANYKFEQADRPGNNLIASETRPFTTFNEGGLRIGVVGMANLSSISSIFDQPNKLGVQPINTAETAQFYVDLIRPYVDVVVFTTHLGLEVDQRMIRNTTGIDVVLGSHNHIVLNPPQTVLDCSADGTNPGFIWSPDPNRDVDPDKAAPNDDTHPDPIGHPWQFRRKCIPRNVVLAHSGAFAKYVGRLDIVLSNNPAEATPTGNPDDYDPNNRFEVISRAYEAFPVDSSIPEEPTLVQMLEPYKRNLSLLADLDTLVGFSPAGAKRNESNGGDSPLGNLVANAIWLRLGVQTDFSLTNSTGVRQDLLPGPITVEQVYNIFPFDNSITKMQLTGGEVEEMFDFVARRSAGRACTTQAQIAGVRVRLNCAGCARPTAGQACEKDEDCPSPDPGACGADKQCAITSCAEQIYIGTTATVCTSDEDCRVKPDGPPLPGSCAKRDIGDSGRCMTPLARNNRYELATSNYLAGGGSGYRVLQRNTTQIDTKIQQRDAFIDYMRQGRACGYRADAGTKEGLKACATDVDCGTEGDFVCACNGRTERADGAAGTFTCNTSGECDPSQGRCVRRDCRDQVAAYNAKRCAASPDTESCRAKLDPCSIGGESCKYLACIDETLGVFSDNRIQMIGR